MTKINVLVVDDNRSLVEMIKEYFEDNAKLLHDYCKAEIDGDKYLGIIQTTWLSVEEKWRERLFNGAEVMADLDD